MTSSARAPQLSIAVGDISYAYRELGPKRGVGGSTGSVPGTIDETADDALAFIGALGFDSIDVFLVLARWDAPSSSWAGERSAVGSRR